jgi:hypothetical protein
VKLRALRSTFCAIQIELFPLDKADHLRHGIFRRDGNEHVDMVGHPMPFLDLAHAGAAPIRGIRRQGASSSPRKSKISLHAISRDENDMIFALPCGRVLVMHRRHWGLLQWE